MFTLCNGTWTLFDMINMSYVPIGLNWSCSFIPYSNKRDEEKGEWDAWALFVARSIAAIARPI